MVPHGLDAGFYHQLADAKAAVAVNHLARLDRQAQNDMLSCGDLPAGNRTVEKHNFDHEAALYFIAQIFKLLVAVAIVQTALLTEVRAKSVG